MKITINQSASFTGKSSIRFNPGDVAGEASYLGKAIAAAAGSVGPMVLNALAYGTYSTARNRLNADGNFYTITFPDDFVHTINDTGTISVTDQSGTVTIPKDPFVGRRSTSSPFQIDNSLDVTIQIPQGMNIGTNSHARHVDPAQVKLGYGIPDAGAASLQEFPGTDTVAGGMVARPATTALGAPHTFLQAAADPCLFFDFDSPKVTPTTLTTSTITIENSGNTIGGGGFGGRGAYPWQTGKGATQLAGGGGGGGQGLHQVYDSSSVIDPPHLFNNYDWNKLNASSGRASGGPADESVGTESGVGGQSASFGEHVASHINNLAANGTAGTISSRGSLGVVSTGEITTLPAATSQTSITGSVGGWGGNLIYIKSNVWTEEAYSGLTFNVINKSTGFMFAGAGGGSGGPGGVFGSGKPGGLWSTEVANNGDGSSSQAYTGGLRGMRLFLNTANVTITNNFTNENSSFGIRGRDEY